MKLLIIQNIMNCQDRLVRMLGVIAVIVGLHPMRAQAATVNVGDYASFTNAIANCADGDTIVFTNNITLSAEIAISGKGLTIQGNHYSVCVPIPGLNGSGVVNASPSTFRVFNINASGKTNTLQNMTVMGGSPSSNGGGILNSSGTLVLQGLTISQSGGASCNGGGLQNSSGALYLRECNISRNAANHGGGFLNSGTGAIMFIERCTFSENQSMSSSGGGGAGENQQTLYANNSTFANNKSTELGGAINNYGGTSYFVDCTFVGNIAYGTGYMGGAIAQHNDGANSGTVSLVNSLFAYNYHFNGNTFDLNDIYNYSGAAPLAYDSIFQSTTNQLGSGSVGTTVYAGDIGGTNDTLFCGGATAQVLGPSGTPIGSGTIYHPSLALVGASQTPTAVLKPGSFAFGKGARAAFSSAPATPVVGYYNGSSWVSLSGSSPANYEVTIDQNGTARGDSATVGAVTSTASGPIVTAAPASQTVPVGGTATLSVTATGIGPLYYQWFKNGAMVPEATDSTLTLAGAGVTNSGVYYVVVTNAYGLSISLPVTVTVGAPQLLAWGDNQYGQLGDGTTTEANLPESVASNVVVAAAGGSHSLYLKGDGTLWAMGANDSGQLGNGTTTEAHLAESVASNVVALAAGGNHSLFLRSDGTLWAMGDNNNGQLGDGTTINRSNAVSVASDVVVVAAGGSHSLYLKGDGTLWAMGYNFYGQLGDGTTINQSNAVSVGSNVVALAAGEVHSVFLKRDGTLWAMGYNLDGQLGNGTTTDSHTPISTASNVVSVAAGGYHTLYLKNDSSLWAMGYNHNGELGDGTTTNKHSPELVASDVVEATGGWYHTLYLKSDGTLWAMGDNTYGELGDGTTTQRTSPVSVPGMSLAHVISGNSAYHTLAVGVLPPPLITAQPTNQTVLAGSPVSFTVAASGVAPLAYQWQFNGTNLLNATNASYTIPSASLNNAGGYAVAVSGSGGSTVSAMAILTVNQNVAAVTLGNLSQTYDGTSKSVTLTTTPTNLPVSLTYNGSGNAPTNAGSYVVIGIVTDANYQGGATNTLVINQATPAVTTWPTASAITYGQTLASSTLSGGAASTGGSFAFTTPSTAPAATALQGVTFTPTDTANYTTVAGSASVIVLLSPCLATQPTNQVVPVGGTVNLSVAAMGAGPFYYQWFKNGGMVSGATNSALSLVGAGMTNSGVYYAVVTNAHGMNLSLAVTVTVGIPQLLAWGNNDYGQLGDGTMAPAQLPESITSNVVAAAAGADHSLFVMADGTLWAVGYNGDGELGDGTTATRTQPESIASNVVAVAAGAWHSLYLKRDGTLWGMGANYNGQLGDGTTTNRTLPEPIASNVVAMAAGWYHSLYLKSDGTLWAMGANDNGELGDGTNTYAYWPQSVASNVVAVAAGAWHSLFLKTDNSLWAMGQDSYGQLGDGTNLNAYLPELVAHNVTAVAAGYAHSLYLQRDGTLWAMGQNAYGQLGSGTNLNAPWPESVASNVVAVTAGMYDSLYLQSDGALWAMGNNSSGELGDGTTTTRYSPVAVPGMSLATAVSSGSANHTLTMGEPLAPVITTQPASQTVLAGNPATFTVTADGVAPLAYQWQFNGTNLLSATNASYTLASVSPGDAGSYRVVVTGPVGSTVSAAATLAVSTTVTVAANPTNAGRVTGGGPYPVGSNTVLTAIASNNWQFSYWNDGVTNNPRSITVPATNSAYTANFAAVATIIVGDNTNAGGTVAGSGTFLVGSTNWISAVASNGWIFLGWSTGATNNPYAIVVTSNLTITADFAPAASVAAFAQPPEGGSTTGAGTYAIGSPAKVTAIASSGWMFLNWNGTDTTNPWTFVVPSSATVCTANFARSSMVTALASPTNAGSVAGGGAYLVGSNTVLTATASNAWQFVQWNDGTTNNPRTITAPATNITYTAEFEPTAVITVVASPSAAGFVNGGGTFLVGTTNWITAAASNNWVFVRWSDNSTHNPYAIVVASNQTFTAEFTAAATVTTLAVPPQGGSTTGNGTYAIGSPATLMATASNGWVFLNWNGTVTNYMQTGDTNNPLGIRVVSSVIYVANFAQVENGFVYTVISPKGNQQAEIIGYTGTKTDNIVVPSVIGGLAVTVIGGGAFWWHSFGKISVPGSIETIEAGAMDAGAVEFLAGAADGACVVIEAGAFAEMGEILLGVGVSALLVDYLVNMFKDLAMVQATADPDSGGSCTGSGLYTLDTTAVLTAWPNNGWMFTGWSDGPTTKTRSVVVGGASTYTANFIQLSTVTGMVNPTNSGTVTGGGTYAVDTQVWLTAVPAEEAGTGTEWEFSHWNDGTTSNPYQITVPNYDVTYTATFEEMVEVEPEAEPTWGGYVTGKGTYPVGTEVWLVATPFSGWRFAGWFWENSSTNIPTIPVWAYPLTKPLSYRAEFVQTIQVIGLANPTNAGSVAGSEVYDLDDTNITLTATASNNWVFIQWNDGATNNPYTIPPITVTNLISITYTASFAAAATITVSANPNVGGSVTGGGTYLTGTSTQLTALATNGWLFTGWNDGTTNTPYRITVPTTNITYTANFTASSPPIITTSISSNTLTLAWPTDHLGWILQAQTNALSTNWFDLPGTAAANWLTFPINSANPAVFYRLRQP